MHGSAPLTRKPVIWQWPAVSAHPLVSLDNWPLNIETETAPSLSVSVSNLCLKSLSQIEAMILIP